MTLDELTERMDAGDGDAWNFIRHRFFGDPFATRLGERQAARALRVELAKSTELDPDTILPTLLPRFMSHLRATLGPSFEAAEAQQGLARRAATLLLDIDEKRPGSFDEAKIEQAKRVLESAGTD